MTRLQRFTPPLFLLSLLVLWLLESQAERHWFLTFVTYVPQHGLFVPLFLLSYSAIRRRDRRDRRALGFHLLSFSLIVWLFLGFNVPLRHLVSRPQNEEMKLRVVSYNLKLSSLSARDVARSIESLNADVVCAQEAPWLEDERAAVAALLKLLPGWHARHDGELLTLSRTPIRMARVHYVENTQIVAAQETEIIFAGKPIRFWNTHIANPVASPRDVAATLQRTMPIRQRQSEALLHRTEQVQNRNDAGMVVLGDFNTPPRGQIYRAFARRFRDAHRESGWGGGATFPTGSPLLRIDFIWLSKHFVVQNCFVSGEAASDHLPLVADIVLK